MSVGTGAPVFIRTVRSLRGRSVLFPGTMMPAGTQSRPFLMPAAAMVAGPMLYEAGSVLGALPSAMVAAVFAGAVALVTVFAVNGTAAESRAVPGGIKGVSFHKAVVHIDKPSFRDIILFC